MADHSLEALYAKLDRADRAGDAEAARVIADKIRRVQGGARGGQTPPAAMAPQAPTEAQLAAQAYRRSLTPQQREILAEQSARNYQTAIQRHQQGDWGALTNYLDAVQHRVLDPVHGAAQLIGHGVRAGVNALVEAPSPSSPRHALERETLPQRLRQYVNDTVAADDAALRQREIDYQQRTRGSVGAEVGGAVGSLLPYLAPTRALQGLGSKVVGAVLPRGAASGVIGKAVSGATQGAITGALPPVTEGDFASGKTNQAVFGAAFGGGVPVATRALAPVLGKAINTARGIADPAVRSLQALGQRHGVRLSVGDLTQHPVPKKLEVALESVPVLGTAGFRATQHDQAKAAAHAVADELHQTMVRTPFRNLAQVERAAGRGNKVATELLQELARAGDDWNRIVQVSGNLQALRSKLTADQLFNKVERLADTTEVPILRTRHALQRALKEVSDAKLPDKPAARLLEELQTTLAPKADALGEAVPAGNTFSALRQLRSDLGDRIRDYYRGANAVVGGKGVGVLQQLRTAVEQDMERFARHSDRRDLAQAWRKADAFYRQRVVPFKDRALASALKDAPADEVFGRFAKAGKGDRAQRFYQALDPKGQAAVRYGLVAQAMDKAVDESRQVFSPAKFAQTLAHLREPKDVFFQGQAKRELDGFAKLMRHVERAGQYAENPPTGQRVIPWLLGGAAALNAPLAAQLAAISGSARALLTTPAGQRFLLAASSLEEGSPAMAKLLQRIERTMPKLAGATAAQMATSERPTSAPRVADE